MHFKHVVNDLKWSKFIKYLNISQGLWIHFTWESIIFCKDISGMQYQIWIYAFQMMFWVALPYSSSFNVCYDAKFCAFQYVTNFTQTQIEGFFSKVIIQERRDASCLGVSICCCRDQHFIHVDTDVGSVFRLVARH